MDRIASEQSAEVKLQLLTATMKLFFKKPPECQDMLGRLLKFCIGEVCTWQKRTNKFIGNPMYPVLFYKNEKFLSGEISFTF